jgi:predicted ATPase
MKKARTEDHWRGLLAKNQPNFAKTIEADAVINFPKAPISITGPITAITGLNGVGKSTILNSIHLLVCRGENPAIELSLLKNCVGKIRGEVISEGEIKQAETDLNKGDLQLTPEALGFEVTWIDSSFEIPDLIKLFRQEKNLEEALAQVGPIIYSSAELEDVSWLVGKTYSSCKVYELDGFYGRPVTPYFSVESDDRAYGMESMGLGEASLHYFFWALKRAESNSLILLEEPETYISSRSQAALMDCLARTCLKESCTAIVTTHSPQIFAKVPPNHTLIIAQLNGETKVICKDSPSARLAALSVPLVNEKAGFLLVEDRMAREFAKQWLQSACPDLSGHWKIVDMGSSGQVLKSLDNFPYTTDRWVRALGLLDGDEQAKGHQSKGAFSFLPGTQPPEKLLRETILGHTDEIADSLNVDPDQFAICLASVNGMDHHDWFLELITSLDGLTSFEELVEVATEKWVAENGDLSNSASEALRQNIKAKGQ